MTEPGDAHHDVATDTLAAQLRTAVEERDKLIAKVHELENENQRLRAKLQRQPK